MSHHQRDVPAVAVSEARARAFPLAPPPPAFLLNIRRGRALEAATGEYIVALDSKRRLIVPGAYQLTGHIVVELDEDLTDEKLRELIVPILPGKTIRSAEDEAKRIELRERSRGLTEAYRGLLGEPVQQLEHSLFSWLEEGVAEAVLRQAFIATKAAADMAPGDLGEPSARYEYLRENVRLRRRGIQKPKPKP